METTTFGKSLLALVLAVCIAVPAAPAAPASARLPGQEEGAAARERIRAVLARPEARQALEARGVPAAQAEARVRALTDAEAIELAARIDALPAGAHPEQILWLPLALIGLYAAGGAGAVVLVVGGAFLFAAVLVAATRRIFSA